MIKRSPLDTKRVESKCFFESLVSIHIVYLTQTACRPFLQARLFQISSGLLHSGPMNPQTRTNAGRNNNWMNRSDRLLWVWTWVEFGYWSASVRLCEESLGCLLTMQLAKMKEQMLEQNQVNTSCALNSYKWIPHALDFRNFQNSKNLNSNLLMFTCIPSSTESKYPNSKQKRSD